MPIIQRIMSNKVLRLLLIATILLLAAWSIWYWYLHMFRVGTETPYAVYLLGLLAGILSMPLFFAGLKRHWVGQRSLLSLAAIFVGAIIPGLTLLYEAAVTAIGPLIFYGY